MHHHHPHEDPEVGNPDEVLHVVTVITNPADYASRIRLYFEFAAHMAKFPNVVLWTIEGSFPGRDYQVTQADHPNHVRVVLQDEIWHKENLLNVLILRHLPPEAKKIAWIDADVFFARPDWVEATLKGLDEHPVLQLFSQCADMDSHYQIAGKELSGELMYGMVYEWYKNKGHQPGNCYDAYGTPDHPLRAKGRPFGHCGYAWAGRREVLEEIGGLLDFSIVGSADFQMTCAWMADIMDAVAYTASPGYIGALQEWGSRVARAREKHGPVGYIDGLVLHGWHGMKNKRGYEWRVNIMKKTDYSPERDVVRDEQGVLCWNHGNPEHDTRLHGELERYFRYRSEDVRSDERPLR